ncbi:hypothetical protein [Halobacterium salinarum]|uniref:hypothetical protein n=1 Tax=Halobacterium salinarum TaxID=2242 RepID=UPI0030CA3990
MSGRHRRAVLVSLGTAAATALAGCNSGSNSGSDQPESGTASKETHTAQNGSGVIADTEVKTTQITDNLGNETEATVLRVSVTDTAIDAITLRNSAGSEIARNQLGTGTATQFRLKNRAADTYDILAVKNGSIIDKRSKTFEREVSVDDLILTHESGLNGGEGGYGGVRTTITNTGDLPVKTDIYRVYGDVPSPVDRDSGLADGGHPFDPIIQPGESRIVANTQEEFVGDSDALTCSGEQRTGKIDLITDSGQETTISFEYSLSGKQNNVFGGDICSKATIHSWTVNDE